jgi:hypothetical protein
VLARIHVIEIDEAMAHTPRQAVVMAFGGLHVGG